RVTFNKGLDGFSYEELTASNSIQFLVELFGRPYNLNKEKLHGFEVNTDQAQEAYEVLRILGVEMAFMDSRVFDSGHRSFMEGNSFSAQLRNDSIFDFYEIYEYLSVGMSASSLAERIYQEIPQSCRLDYKDVHFAYVTEARCFRKVVQESFSNYFDNLPVISDFWKRLSKNHQMDFWYTLEYASRAGAISEKPFDMPELRIMVAVLYYLETIFYNFDSDGNGIAEGDEVRKAEKHFRALVVDFINDVGPKLIASALPGIEGGADLLTQDAIDFLAPRVFTYLLFFGKLPEGKEDLDSVAKLATDEWLNLHLELVKADPLRILRIFATLAKVNLKGHRQKVETFLLEGHQELASDLDAAENPICFETPDRPFCRWSREIFCNETTSPAVYQWMRENRGNLFANLTPNAQDEDRVEGAMKLFGATFYRNSRFSTHCGFPVVDQEPPEDVVTRQREEEAPSWNKLLFGVESINLFNFFGSDDEPEAETKTIERKNVAPPKGHDYEPPQLKEPVVVDEAFQAPPPLEPVETKIKLGDHPSPSKEPEEEKEPTTWREQLYRGVVNWWNSL
ncbi:MAG: hypothetical protein AAF203_09650, partial [Pseudomonadota bacterium]